MEWMLGNTFSFLVFGTFGAAWLALACSNLPMIGAMGAYTTGAVGPEATAAAEAEFYSSFGECSPTKWSVVVLILHLSFRLTDTRLRDHNLWILCSEDQHHLRIYLRNCKRGSLPLRRILLGARRRQQARCGRNAEGRRSYILHWMFVGMVSACGQFVGSAGIWHILASR